MEWSILFGLIAALALVLARMVRGGDLPKVGEAAPQFELPDQDGAMHALSEYAGSWLVLYFYPKDDTPGCTREACAFRDDMQSLARLGTQVVGISVDDSNSHAAFAKKYGLPFTLLADTSAETARRYGALLNLGFVKVARRYTFLIDPAGKIAKVYVKVATSKHSREIIEDLEQLTEKRK